MSLAYIPALTSAVLHVRKEESGLASGLVNTSYQVGSALGLAIMVAIASAQTLSDQNSSSISSIDALNNGFHVAFIAAAAVAAIAAVVAFVIIKNPNKSGGKQKDEEMVAPTSK